MGKVNLNQILKDFDGNEIDGKKECFVVREDMTFIEQDGKRLAVVIDDKPLTAKAVIISALLAPDKQEQVTNTSGEELLKKYQLAKRISNTKNAIVLLAEDITLIKKKLERTSPPLIYGLIHEILEPETVAEEGK